MSEWAKTILALEGAGTMIGSHINDSVKSKGFPEVLRYEGAWGIGCIDPHCLDLGTSCR
jgi:hypothetical protein